MLCFYRLARFLVGGLTSMLSLARRAANHLDTHRHAMVTGREEKCEMRNAECGMANLEGRWTGKAESVLNGKGSQQKPLPSAFLIRHSAFRIPPVSFRNSSGSSTTS
jgi:hypothetical protein